MSYVHWREKDGRQPPLVDPAIWAWTAGIGVFLIALGMLLNSFAAARLRDLTARVADLEPRREEYILQLPLAQTEVDNNRHLYASHHSERFDAPLAEAGKSLATGGPVQVAALAAQQALVANDRNTAEARWAEADRMLAASKSIIDQILGPPRFYEKLKSKADAVNQGYLDRVNRTILDQNTYIDNKPDKYLCGSASVLSYSSAYEIVAQARSKLDNEARPLLNVQLPEGVIDKPLVYDLALEAENLANSARSAADNLEIAADSASAEIANLDSQISTAESKLNTAWEYDSAQSYYDQAVTQRDLALDACIRQDFAALTSFVQDGLTYAYQSYEASLPPPPTPVPQQPSSSDSENDDSGPIIDWSDDWSADPGPSTDTSDDGWEQDTSTSSDPVYESPDYSDSSDDWDSGWESTDDWDSNDDWSEPSDDWSDNDGW